jgi:hypothetical protein
MRKGTCLLSSKTAGLLTSSLFPFDRKMVSCRHSFPLLRGAIAECVKMSVTPINATENEFGVWFPVSVQLQPQARQKSKESALAWNNDFVSGNS